VLGVAFCEAIVKPMAWEELSPPARARGQAIRAPGAEDLLPGQDTFIRQAFTGGGVLTPVSDHDIDIYLSRYPDPDSRRPILAWARQMPLGGEPGEPGARRGL
jgi:haloalkane dehalogenase